MKLRRHMSCGVYLFRPEASGAPLPPQPGDGAVHSGPITDGGPLLCEFCGRLDCDCTERLTRSDEELEFR